MRNQFISTLTEIASIDERIMLITGDLGYGVFEDYERRFPAQFLNAGIAEQNMTLVATGLALEGRIVFTYSIGNFPTLRCLEMIRNDAAYHNANVKVISIGGGFSYGALGISHHATEDLSIMRALPDVTCFAPTGLYEVQEATKALVETDGTGYMRLDKDPGVNISLDVPFEIGIARLLRKGSDIVFFCVGGIISEVIDAIDVIEETSDLSCTLYSVPTIRPLDKQNIVEGVQKHALVVTVEEHTLNGGLGGLLLETLCDSNIYPDRLLRIGLDGCFSTGVGSQKYLRSKYQMDSTNIVRRTMDAYSLSK